MKGIEAYQLFRALSLHFHSDSYDYFRYNGKTRAISQTSFETRKDRYQYEKLARHRDPLNLLVANFVDNDIRWVGDISVECYNKWLKRVQSLSYNFKNETKLLEDNFNSFLSVRDGQHPKIFSMHSRGEISSETLVILDGMLGLFDYWSANISEKIIWPKQEMRLKKYRPFVDYDVDKYRKILHNTIIT